MKTEMIDICEMFFLDSQIPVGCYDSTRKLICSYSAWQTHGSPLLTDTIFLSRNTHRGNPCFLTSDSQGFYSLIELPDSEGFIIVGPVFNVPVMNSTLHKYMKENVLSHTLTEDVSHFLQNIPLLSYTQFVYKVLFLYCCLTREKISLSDYLESIPADITEKIAKRHSLITYENKEKLSFHGTWHFEQQLLSQIKNGNVDKLKDFLINVSASTPMQEGILASNPLRQAKNIFIGCVTMIGKFGAIPGGLDVEQTYQLIDLYCQECERLQTVDSVNQLLYTMLLDFCNRVGAASLPSGCSSDIFSCINFINEHTNKPLHVSDVAAHIGRSTSYLSNKFRDELGFSVGSFITRCKLEEAKSLLSHTDKTISEISNYLCFSSQSYFQNVFRKKYGITPAKYRRQSHPQSAD